jgi:DNA mismatch endonuclease, patch repair protein
MPARPRKAPKYDECRPASPAASRAKRRNRPKGTAAELLLRQALWAEGLRYRLHAKELPGKPDIVFRRQRLAVFVDGDFWHGRNWLQRREKLEMGSNADYWIAKIGYNIERDANNRHLLENMGWTVQRFWETDVLARPEEAAAEVARRLWGS